MSFEKKHFYTLCVGLSVYVRSLQSMFFFVLATGFVSFCTPIQYKQNDWLYLQSINPDKHLPQVPLQVNFLDDDILLWCLYCEERM